MPQSPPGSEPVPLTYPLTGWIRARNSPARRVPSHGTDLMGTTYAIDLIPVDSRGRAARGNWRAVLTTEEPETFVGFGAVVRSPATGTVVIAHDGERDHEARRSQLALVPYLAAQPRRIRRGPGAIAGNHVVISLGDGGPYVLTAHLRKGSVRVQVGDRVTAGRPIGQCGNSGNSTQPHVHVQVTDSTDWARARGLPIVFRTDSGEGLPRESEIVFIPDAATERNR
ncbi:M23 family metallopeptidase [Planctomonas psychrotolerans]|uniref:M23 family metallopeptidase n=1 Tax=Planctomonas psychrotolerans TaxID=2528712 RepID=UPI001D0D2FE8|nr:M23 family metallopeptidase [Planctomonas psychrotolerans]